MQPVPLSNAEFNQFRQLIAQLAGISMSEAKRSLVSGRLAKRVNHFGLDNYSDYLDLISQESGKAERQIMVDLLTTNETYFFREPAHFDYLAGTILPALNGDPVEIWSAACSTGEEVYTLCMVLAEQLGLKAPWRVTGSDISTRVLANARSGHYPMAKRRGLPDEYLKRYCLKGVRSAEGTFLIDPALRQRTRFLQVNLNETLPEMGMFDVIFLRNVMIYFDQDTKREVVRRLEQHLRPGGHFIVGHSESLHGISDRLKLVRPTIYRKAP